MICLASRLYVRSRSSRDATNARLSSPPRCAAPSRPCSTQHAGNGPGPCRDLSWPDGFVGDDGVPNARAAEGNAVLQGCIRIALAAASHDAAIAFESPVSRAAGTAHAIPGRETHAAMWDTTFWRAFAAQLGDYFVEFDQCAFSTDVDGTRGLQKSTRIAGDERTIAALRRHIGPSASCDGRHRHTPVLQPRRPDGSWASTASAFYSPELNHILARSISDSVTERALAAAASILWDGPTGRTAAATVRTLARARSSKVDRVARRGPSVLTTIARAIADCRPPVDRSLDDRLDAAARVPCYSLLRPGAALRPCAAYATGRYEWLDTSLYSSLCATAGLPPSSPTFESPFDAGQPCPIILAAQS